MLLPFFSLAQVDEGYVEREKPYGYEEWTDYMWCVRAGVGVQQSTYLEGGISRLKYTFNDRSSFSHAQYLSFEWTPTLLPDKERNIFGLKLGWESNFRALALGLEGKYLTDQNDDTWVLTPRIGAGMFGIFNIFYGYNIFLVSNALDDIGVHQLSIVVNLNSYLTKTDRSRP